MAAAIFNGSAIKLLKEILRFKSGVEIITNDSDDPTSVAKNAPQGSMYIRSGTGDVYIKQDNGSSTNWSQVSDDADLATKANITLNNLGTTSINADLLPSANNTRSVGSTTLNFLRNFSGQVLNDSHSETGTLTGDTTSGSDLITNVTGDQTFFSSLAIVTGTGIPANTLASRQSATTFRMVNFSLAPQNATSTNTGITITWTGLPFGSLLTSLAKPTTGASASVNMTSGRTVDNSSGGINISSGNSFRASGVATGAVTITSGISGNESGTATTGAINIATGRSFSSGATGNMILGSGASAGTGGTGTVGIGSGNSTTANSGATTITTGTTTTANSGNTTIQTGNSTSNGTTGNVIIQTGSTSGTRGNIDVTGAAVNITSSVGSISLNSTTSVNVNNKQVINLASPTLGTDAANKDYVDAVAQGVKAKQAVLVATTADITLSGEQTIDGVLTSASRVLVKDQADPTENGIYTTDAGSWTRTTDFDSITPIDEINGAIVGIMQGTTQAGQIWVNTGGVVTVGVDAINFVYFNSVSTLNAGNGIDITGTTLSVDHDGEGLTFSSAQLALELDGTTLSKTSSGLRVATDGITNNEINASAAIAYSKLNLGNSIVDADVSGSAAISYSKLNLSNSIVDADISGSAAITLSKLATLTTNRAVVSNGSGVLSASATTDTEVGYLSGVTSAIQTQLDSKLNATIISQSISFTAAKNVNYLVDSSGGPLSVALPAATGGGWVRIVDAGAAETNNIGIDPDGAETINGNASYTIESNYQSVLLLSTGTEWIIA